MTLNDAIVHFALRCDLALPMTAKQYTALAKQATKSLKLKPLKVKATTDTSRRRYRYTVEVKA
jgi:hypothetical protein